VRAQRTYSAYAKAIDAEKYARRGRRETGGPQVIDPVDRNDRKRGEKRQGGGENADTRSGIPAKNTDGRELTGSTES